METLIIFFAAIVLINLGFALLLVRYTNTNWVRMIGVVLFVALIPGSYLSYDFLLSKPRPVLSSFLQSTGEAKLLKHLSVKDEAIYLWVQEEEKIEPVYVALPYSSNLAKEIDKAVRKAKKGGGTVLLKNLKKMARDAAMDKKNNQQLSNSGKSFGNFDALVIKNPMKQAAPDNPLRLLQNRALDINKPGARGSSSGQSGPRGRGPGRRVGPGGRMGPGDLGRIYRESLPPYRVIPPTDPSTVTSPAP